METFSLMPKFYMAESYMNSKIFTFQRIWYIHMVNDLRVESLSDFDPQIKAETSEKLNERYSVMDATLRIFG